MLFIMLHAKHFPVCGFTEVNESEGTLTSSPPNKDGRCCLGGVDFLTLVCVIFKHLALIPNKSKHCPNTPVVGHLRNPKYTQNLVH